MFQDLKMTSLSEEQVRIFGLIMMTKNMFLCVNKIYLMTQGDREKEL